MLVMGEGRNHGVAQLQILGKQHGIKNGPEILAKVQSEWCSSEKLASSRLAGTNPP
jgi:hypothetical protein